MTYCKCLNWATHDVGLAALLGHHPDCEHAPEPVGVLRQLVVDLAHGMDAWAADEDGIHPKAWEAYKKAKLLAGEIVTETEG